MKTATVRIKRIVCLVVAFLLAVSGMGISAHAASQFAIEGKSYELTDESSFEINENKSQDMLCYGAAHIGTLEVSGEVNEQTTYNSWIAIGAHGAVTLTYSYDGAYQTSNKEQWNLTTSSSKVVNGIDLGKKVENGAIIVEYSADGKKWETVSVQTNVFHKKSTDISIYTIDEADVRNGSYYRITMAYRMQQKTGTEYVLGIFPTDVYEYREFVEVREFYVCYNKDPITLRDVETGAEITGNQSTKGFIVDMAGTTAKVTMKNTETGAVKTLTDLATIIDRGSYQITVTTNLGKTFTRKMTVAEGMEMTAVSPQIIRGEEYKLDGSSGNTPFGMTSLTTLKIGHQADSRITTGTVSGINAYGITGDSLSLYLRIKDFSNAQANGWSISSDAWGKKEKQTVAGTWAGVVGTGALVVQTSQDGKNWEDASDGKYASGLYTTDFFTHYGNRGDVLIYTPDGNELLNGIYIRVVYAYQVGRNGEKSECRIIEAYECYLCSNELGAVTFKNLSVSQNIEEVLGLDNEIDVTVCKKAETLVSGSGTVTGFEIDRSLNPTVRYQVYRNGRLISATRNNRYTTQGKYEIHLTSAVGTTEVITIYVDPQSSEQALAHYFGDGFIEGKRIYSDGAYPVYEGGLTTYHIAANSDGYLPIAGTIHNISTNEVIEIKSGTTEINGTLETPGHYVATFSTCPIGEGSELPGDYRVFEFQFEIIAAGSAPGPIVNQRSLAEFAKTNAADSYPMYYGLIYHSAAAGNIKIAFATKEAAVEYAYNYEKGTVEIQEDGSFRYTGSFVLTDKVKYNSAWDLTDAMYYFAEQAVQVLYFDMSDPYTYRTLKETVIENTSNLRTLELNGTVTIFGDGQCEMLCSNESLPIISPKPFAYLNPGLNGKVETGYLDFEFIKDKNGYDSSSVVIIDANGKEYSIAYNTGVGQQLLEAGCPSGIVTIREQTIYGDEVAYQAVFIADGENTASITLSYYSGRDEKTIEFTQADDGTTITVDAFAISSIVDPLDPYALVTISDATNSYQYVADQMATGAWTTPGDYEITVTNRLGFTYTVNITVTDSGYSALMFTGEGTEGTKAIVAQYGDEHVSLPEIQRYGYKLVGYQDENGQVYTDEISKIMFKGTIVLNAVWEAKQFTIHFRDPEGNTVADSVTVDYGSEYELPELNLGDGVELLGWSINGEALEETTLKIDKEGDIVVIASLSNYDYSQGDPVDDTDNANWGVVAIAAVGLIAAIVIGLKIKTANRRKKDIASQSASKEENRTEEDDE